ncbi:unnamed protein product, partial [Heterosigma akashiwo]
GHYSLSRSDESIAALVIALYPRFPSYSTDNQYHLQGAAPPLRSGGGGPVPGGAGRPHGPAP